jgi:hypothetical protein
MIFLKEVLSKPNTTHMQFIAGTPIGMISDISEVIEIKLWEVYLLNNRSNLTKTLTDLSRDHGPVENVRHEHGRVSYRFLAGTWESTVKPLLYENRIPVIIKPTIIHESPVNKRGKLVEA